MKLSKLVLLGLPLVLFGCPTDDEDTDTDTDVATDTDDTDDTDPPTDTEPPPIEFSVELVNGTPDQMVITVTNGTGVYNFGYAETFVDNGWFGEDCFNGQPGTTINICHVVDGSLTLDEVDTIDAVVASQTMLLDVQDPASDTPPLTYKIEAEDGTCWVWGDDISYYDGAGCEEYIAPM